MRAWVVHEFGALDKVLQLREWPRPGADSNAVLVSVTAAGLNFPDALIVAGLYQSKPELPFVPGAEAVGRVVEAAEDCVGLGPGQRVLCWAGTGAFAEYLSVSADRVFEVPEGMPDQEAAGFLMTYQTAYFALVQRARIQPGEHVLVHGGAGGVGSAAIQLGKALGATVIATAGSGEKRALCRRLGADHVIDYEKDDFVEGVKAITGRNGADVILDPVGGDVFARSTKCIAWEGRIVTVGFTSGDIPTIAVHRILLKNISVIGLHWSEYLGRDPGLVRESYRQLVRLYCAKKIRPVVGRSYPMERLPEALDAFRRRTVLGKSVLWVGKGSAEE